VITVASLGDVATLIGASAAVVAAIGGVWAAFIGVREYQLKSKAQRVEIDVQLSKLLAELVPIANGRGTTVASETAAEVIAQRQEEPEKITEALKSAVIQLPVGEATQAAAITSIGYLGSEHPALREPAHQALQALNFVDDRPNLRPARKLALELVEQAQR
jgi:hypothetical protein